MIIKKIGMHVNTQSEHVILLWKTDLTVIDFHPLLSGFFSGRRDSRAVAADSTEL